MTPAQYRALRESLIRSKQILPDAGRPEEVRIAKEAKQN